LDEVERATPQPPLRFTTITVPPGIGSIRELLLRSHLYPDSDAIGLMYALNPDLRDPLQPGTNVRNIQIALTPEAAKALSDGFLFKIYYDDKIIAALTSSRGKVLKLTAAISSLAPERFAEPSLRQTTLDCVSSISADFDRIADFLEDRHQPTNHEMLSQVLGDVELLLRSLGRITTEAGTVTADDKNATCVVANDLKIKEQGFEGATMGTSTFLRWPEAHVLVNTVDSVTHRPLSMLTIQYAPAALQNDLTWVKSVFAPSSPTELELPEADYVFWVTKDGGGSPASNRMPASVRKTQDSKPVIVGIFVKQ